jgi:hypothetical protein
MGTDQRQIGVAAGTEVAPSLARSAAEHAGGWVEQVDTLARELTQELAIALAQGGNQGVQTLTRLPTMLPTPTVVENEPIMGWSMSRVMAVPLINERRV